LTVLGTILVYMVECLCERVDRTYTHFVIQKLGTVVFRLCGMEERCRIYGTKLSETGLVRINNDILGTQAVNKLRQVSEAGTVNNQAVECVTNTHPTRLRI